MTDAPKSSSLLQRVQARLQIASLARSSYIASLVILGLSTTAVLLSRLLGLIPRSQENVMWLLAVPAGIALAAALFHRRVQQQIAARAVDQHADTKDLFLTLASLQSSAGEYQPLVASAAEQRAEGIVPDHVVPFQFGRKLLNVVGVCGLFALAIFLTPQLDPFGRVEAATRIDEQKKEIESIRRSALARADRLKKEQSQADEASEEIDSQVNQLKSDFRRMKPREVKANSKVLEGHRADLNSMWKSAADNEQLRRMMSEPISRQQLGGSRTEKMNQWLKELQDGKTDSLQQQLKKAQETMQAMAEAKDPEERKKLASQLQDDLQDLNRFARNKAGSKELTSALSKAMKALRASKNSSASPDEMQLSEEATEALKQSLEVAELEMERLAQSASDLKKLEDAIRTLQQAQELNQQQQLDGSQCENCESLEDYAELYAQLMGEQGAGDGEKDLNEGDGESRAGRGGETPEDDSDPEGYKKEKERPQIQAGKILLSIKTREYADENEVDPDSVRAYRQTISDIKSGVQSAIDSEEIPPGYVDGIKGYFDKIEDVDPTLQSN